MTTLSKEDVVRMAGISGISIGNSESSPYPTNFQLHAFATLVRADLVAENERLTDSNQMYLDRIEYLERKYRCHNEYAKRPILYDSGAISSPSAGGRTRAAICAENIRALAEKAKGE